MGTPVYPKKNNHVGGKPVWVCRFFNVWTCRFQGAPNCAAKPREWGVEKAAVQMAAQSSSQGSRSTGASCALGPNMKEGESFPLTMDVNH